MERTDADQMPAEAAEGQTGLDLACRETVDRLEGIQRGERVLEAYDPECYQWIEWIGDIKFMDRTRILSDVQNACSLVDDCLAAKRYDLVLLLGYQLLRLEVKTDDETGCVEEVEFNELCYVNVDSLGSGHSAEIPIQTLLMDMMQAEYRIGEHPQEAIRALMDFQNYQKMRLQDLLDAMGGAPEDFPQFLHGWVALLTQKTDALSVTLAKEAILMMPDLASQLECVRACIAVNPQLYLTVVRNEALSKGERYQAAMDGVQRIAEKQIVRSEVALEAAALAVELDLPRQDIEALWREAFRSDTSPLNYLRLRLYSEDPAAAWAWMDTVLVRPLPEWSYGNLWLGRPKCNYKSAFRTFLFRLLKGDFQAIFQKSIWDTAAVPPEASVIFTVLFQGEPESLLMRRAEKDAMSGLFFDPNVFQMGMPRGEQEGMSREQVFRDCLRQWKGTIAYPSPEERLQLLDQLAGSIEKNVAATLVPCSRKEYPDKAALVATYGEVRESLGEANGKQKALSRYAERWHTHRAFTRELHNFGWKN